VQKVDVENIFLPAVIRNIRIIYISAHGVWIVEEKVKYISAIPSLVVFFLYVRIEVAAKLFAGKTDELLKAQVGE
jgi:hypothetical protein